MYTVTSLIITGEQCGSLEKVRRGCESGICGSLVMCLRASHIAAPGSVIPCALEGRGGGGGGGGGFLPPILIGSSESPAWHTN